MSAPITPKRDDLRRFIGDDQRTIRAFEDIFEFVKDVSGDEGPEGPEGPPGDTGPPGTPAKIKDYGSFFDTSIQSADAINTPKEVTFNSTNVSSGVSVSGAKINITEAGDYKLDVRIQL